MKKFLTVLMVLLLLWVPMSYADEFDTNKISGTSSTSSSSNNSSSSSSDSDAYKYWGYYKTTGTRYVIRVYDWNSQKYIAVPKQYYINHVQESSNNQVIYFGVDKQANGKYEIVKSGQTIFTDNTYEHITKWYNNSNVKNFGLTKNDVNLLASMIRDKATQNGNTILAKNMQDVINGVVPYDVRAEILFLMKIPGKNGAKKVANVLGKGSVENYSFVFYANEKQDSNKWKKDYLTYLECRAVAYSFGDDCGFSMKSTWLDKVACALYEKDAEYVFANGVYQCSCDWYKHVSGGGVVYSLVKKQIVLNQPGKNPGNKSDRWYLYYPPGRCGIPINVNGITYYITAGKTYGNLGGSKATVKAKIQYTDMGADVYDSSYINVVTDDATRATLYEGWDYITNKMAGISVIAVDKDTGNVIRENNVPYSTYENVGAGTYSKNAWNIAGYEFLGNIVRNDLRIPSVPLGIADTNTSVGVTITASDVENGAKKQIIFVYQKGKDPYQKEARISIYSMKKDGNEIMYTGSFSIDQNHQLLIQIYDRSGVKKYTETIALNAENTYDVNTTLLEQKLGINTDENKYLGNMIKKHSDYFLAYMGETLNTNAGNIYNLNQLGENKVHIILGYVPFDEIDEGNPGLKVSYLDNKGNPIPNMEAKITEEKIGEEITTMAKDLRKDMYMYLGYIYVDSLENFEEISIPPQVMDKVDHVKTTFERGYDRRHIAFIYRKIELKFEIDIVMEPNSLANQLIGQVANEDYWVLDEPGRVVLKVKVSGTEGLNMLGYHVKLRIPFDTVMNGSLIHGNTINNLNVSDLSHMIVADKLMVPVWVKEGKYNIDAMIEANVDGFGIVSANKQDDVEVVGRLYDFTITNLDGSEKTGDEKWKTSLFANESAEYKAKSMPIGQRKNQPEKYYYGMKLGTTFYFSINTKGISNDAISIIPKFWYVSNDGKTVKEVDIYYNEDGKTKNILGENTNDRVMKLKDSNVQKAEVLKEVTKAQEMNKVLSRYNYSYTVNRNLGKLAKVVVPKYLSLPYVNYVSEFKSLYGADSLNRFVKTENEVLTYATHWYGKYLIPASSKIVEKGASANSKNYQDGFVIVCFQIISLYSDGNGYLSYNLPTSNTQWQKENLNQLISLPWTNTSKMYREVLFDTLKEGYAPVAIYQVGISTLDNVTSIGTH